MRIISAVFTAATVMATVAISSGPANAGELMIDRCSGDVAIVPFYDARPETPGTVILKRDSNGWTPWTEVFHVGTGGSGHIRWWCKSTTGNWFDPGTWRIEDVNVATTCSMDSGGSQSCFAIPEFQFGSSAWQGWTPERSRCGSRTGRIRAFLGPNRLLRIECL